MIGVGRTPMPLRPFYLVMVGLLYLPIAVLFVFSFGSGTTLSFPIEGLTLDWYGSVLGNGPMLTAARNSLIVGLLAATVATTLGGMVEQGAADVAARASLLVSYVTGRWHRYAKSGFRQNPAEGTGVQLSLLLAA